MFKPALIALALLLSFPAKAGSPLDLPNSYYDAWIAAPKQFTEFDETLKKLTDAFPGDYETSESEKLQSFNRDKDPVAFVHNNTKKKQVTFRVMAQKLPKPLKSALMAEFPDINDDVLSDYNFGMSFYGREKKDGNIYGSVVLMRDPKASGKKKDDKTLNSVDIGDSFKFRLPPGTQITQLHEAKGGKILAFNIDIPGSVEQIRASALGQFNGSKVKFRETTTEDGFSIRFEDTSTPGRQVVGSYVVVKDSLIKGHSSGVLSLNKE